MCLALVGKVKSRSGDSGEVVISGVTREISFIALPDARVGQSVIVSLGMALETISESEAQEIASAWQEIKEIEQRLG